jgi:nitrite reductase/ring-hydroxylating ferredoxin subunit
MPERVPERLICASDALVDGGPGVRFSVSRAADVRFSKVSAGDTALMQAEAFVVRFKGRPYAYLNRCGHVPIELDWQHGDFFDFSGEFLICATHGALYGPESGRCVSGRCAGKGLLPVTVVEKNGAIYWQDDKEEG